MGRRDPRPGTRHGGRVPSYWWDFHWEGGRIVSIKVETDDPRVADGIAETIPLPPGDGPADAQIAMADAMIADLRAGRRSVA